MIDPATVATVRFEWKAARRIIRSIFPPIDLFEDIADPADWAMLASAEQKTNPRLMESIGAIDLVPANRRVGGAGASFLMAPFTHVSPERKSRFGDGRLGVLYVADRFETALAETIHHHERFMRKTREAPGWTSQFRELSMDVALVAHDLLDRALYAAALDPDDYAASQALGAALRAGGSDGIIYPSVRQPAGECAALFYPDLASRVRQGRHLDYHWNGERVDYVREPGKGRVTVVG